MLKLSDNNRLHLSFLAKQNENVVQDFCRLAWDYIAKGVNAKLYTTTAQKLDISPQDLQHVVEALVNLLLEACKHKISLPKLKNSLAVLDFNQKQAETICSFYTAKQADINNVLLAASVHLPMFKDLEWRTQAQLGSRALPVQMTPKILLNLKLDNNTPDNILLQTDPANLVHITQVLETALSNATNNHSTRIYRRFKTS
ncbi:COMM domain-containing protein 2 [Rhodnius prolixus]